MNADYWEILKSEQSVWEVSYANAQDMFDLAIKAWEAIAIPAYFTDVKDGATITLMYETQVDVALKRTIDSVLRREYSQAIYNFRLAIENMGIALMAYGTPDRATLILEDRSKTDHKMREASRRFLDEKYPKFSNKLRELHKFCDESGAHQSLGHHSAHFDVNEAQSKFEVRMHGQFNFTLTVGILGVMVGCIVDHDKAFRELPSVDSISFNTDSEQIFRKIAGDLEFIKSQNRNAFSEYLSS